MGRQVSMTRPIFWITGTIIMLSLGLLAALVLLPGFSLLELLRWLDSGICAQLPTHSFYPGGQRLPLCARNTGIYLSFIVTIITLYARKRGRVQRLPPRYIFILLLCGMVLLVIDGLNSFFLDLGLPHLYQPQNLLRLATGLMTGMALAVTALPILNHFFWCEFNEQRSIVSWWDLPLFIFPLFICFFAVASQSVFVLYPVALLSTAGLVLALSSINLIVVIAISKRDQTLERYNQIMPFLAIAFFCAIGELLILAQLKITLLQALGA